MITGTALWVVPKNKLHTKGRKLVIDVPMIIYTANNQENVLQRVKPFFCLSAQDRYCGMPEHQAPLREFYTAHALI